MFFKKGAPYIPMSKGRGFTAHFDNVQIEVSVNDSATGTLLAMQPVEVGTLWWSAKEIYTISIPISSMPSGGVHIQCSLSGNYRNLLPGGTISQNPAARSSQNKQPNIFDFLKK